MKKLLIALLLILCSAGHVRAESLTQCIWVWSTSFASTTADPPDYVYCDLNRDGTYTSQGVSYGQNAFGATSMDFTWDTDIADGVTTVGGLHSSITNANVICSNAGATVDLNVLGSSNGTQYSEGGVWYWTASSLADEAANNFTLTPLAYWKLGATEASGTAACMVVYTSTYWK